MYESLDRVRLKDGSQVVVARVKSPDSEWAPRLAPFLAHKGLPWTWQIDQTLRDSVGRLEAYYYFAHRDGEIISTVCTYEHAGAGTFGHVFTAPDQRRKGACKAIMNLQMDDFRGRGGRALFLGTGYDSVPWHIYHSFGFRPVSPGSGHMDYYSQDEERFEESYFASGTAKSRDIEWADWAGLVALMACSTGPRLRTFNTEAIGRTNFEGPFLPFYRDLLDEPEQRARVIEVEATGSVVGFAHLAPDTRFGRGVSVLDLYVHLNHSAAAGALIESLDLPSDRKLQAYVGSDDPTRRSALEAAGFRQEAILRDQLRAADGPMDVILLERR